MDNIKNPANPTKGELRTVRVFVSSTFRDMHAERDYLNRVVFPELRSRCAKKGLEFVGIDLRWGITEEESRHRKAMQICLEEIKKCNFFISLLGDRYGWVPPPEEIPQERFAAARSNKDLKAEDANLLDEWYQLDEISEEPVYRLHNDIVPDTIAEKLVQFWEETGLEHAGDSITACEIDLAQAEKSIKKTFFYLRNSGVHENPHFPKDMIPIFIDQDSNKLTKLVLLKQHILDQKHEKIKVQEYTADYDGLRIDPSDSPSNLNDKEKEAFNDSVIQPDELLSLGDKVRKNIRSKGTVAMSGMEELGNLILNDLWGAIEKELEQSSEPQDAHSQERAYHDRFITERTKLFLGRTELLEDMLGYVSNIEEKKPLVITGLPGCGKSALMAECARQCRERFPDALIVPYFIGGAPGSTDLLSTISSLCETLRRECKLEDEPSADPDKLRGQLHTFLEKAGSMRSIIMILDAVNQLDPAYRSHELTWIPFTLPSNVRLIVSTLACDCLEGLQKRVPQKNIVQVPVLAEPDRKYLIKEHLKTRGKKLSDTQIACLLDTEKRKEAGLPLFLLVALEELCLSGNYEELNRQIDKLPATLHELFEKVIERLEGEHFVDRTEFILSLMAVSRYGLLESEILDLLKTYDAKILRISWTRLYRSLEFYLRPVDERTGAGLINFSHDQLRFAVFHRYLGMKSLDADNTEKYRYSHNRLADYFHSIASDKNELAKWSIENPRSLIELPYHLHESERDEELRKMLFDFGWINAKLESNDVNSLIKDYDYISNDRTLRLVQGALQLSSHVLMKREQIQSQLTGRLLSFQEPEIRSLLEGANEMKTNGLRLRLLTASLTPPGGPLIRTLNGHIDVVSSVSVLPYGNRAISASYDGTLKVWDMETGIETRTLKGHTSGISSVSVTPDGFRAISGSFDGTLKIWDIEIGVEIRTLKGHTAGVISVSVTPDGRRAISGSIDSTLKLWDIETGVEIRTFKGHTARIRAVSVTHDGRYAISASDDKTLKVWDIETGVEFRTLKGHTGWVLAVSVTPDGRRAISTSLGGTLKVWDMETGFEIPMFNWHNGMVSSVSVTPDGRYAISASSEGTIIIWDLETGIEIRTFRGQTAWISEVSRWISSVSVTPDGKHAISASSDNTLKVWDLEAGIETRTMKGHIFPVKIVSVTPDSRHAISASWDGTFKVWDMETGVEIRTIKGHRLPEMKAAFVTSDGKHAISASFLDVKFWDIENGIEIRTLKGHTGRVSTVTMTPDGRRAISASFDGTLKVWDIETGVEIRTLKGHTGPVRLVSVTPDGRHAISASDDKTLKVWDIETGIEIQKLEGHTGPVSSVHVTPDGRRAISVSDDKTLKVWDIETGVEIRTLKGHTGRVSSVSVTPDSKRAISASDDKTLKVWDIETGLEILTLKGHTGGISLVSVTPDSRCAISASDDKTLKVWDLKSGRIIAGFYSDSAITAFEIALDGKTIAAGETSGRVHFLRLEGIIPETEMGIFKKTLAVCEKWDIGGGWILTVQSIDILSTPRQAWLELNKDGVKKEDIIVTLGNMFTYVEKTNSNGMDIPLFTIFVDSIFAGATNDFVSLIMREKNLTNI